MSESAGDRKLNVRNLSSEVFDALTALSVTHDRSLEAEARQAIRAWVEPQLSRDARSGRALAVGQRLSHLLAEINRFTSGAPVPVSQIAEAMGLSHASAAQSWFAGEEEPSFTDLDRLVRVFGCDRDWLVHDRGAPFPSRYARIPENPAKAVAWLLKPPADGGAPPRLSLVRSAAQAGSFALVKHYGEWYAQTLRTPYHISDDAGGSGEATLAWLTLGLQALHRACLDQSDGSIKSFIVGQAEFDALLAGRQHPENVLSSREAEECPWWKDIWDESQFDRTDYWPGWANLVRRIKLVADEKQKQLDAANTEAA
jgi:plasmid stability protein